jgi:hypothetical protein
MVQLVVHHAQGVERLVFIRTQEVPGSRKPDSSVCIVTVLRTERLGFDLHDRQELTATAFTGLMRSLDCIPVSKLQNSSEIMKCVAILSRFYTSTC